MLSGPDLEPKTRVDAAIQDMLRPIDFKSIAGKMWRQKRYIFGTPLLAVAGTLIYCLTAQPQYTSSSKLLIEPQQPLVLNQNPTSSDTSETVDTAYVDSQVEVLVSGKVLKRVVASQNLLADPEFTESAFNPLRVVLALIPTAAPASPDVDDPLNTTIDNLRRATTIKRVGFTYALTISVSTRSPQKSARIANAIADAFLKDGLEARGQAASSASSWLQGRMKELRSMAVAADAAVQEFRAKNNIVSTDKGLMTDQQVTEISSQLTQARSQLAEAKAKSDRLSAAIASGSPDRMAVLTDLPVGSIVSKLQQNIINNDLRISELVKANGEQHESVLKLRAENGNLSTNIAHELDNISSSLRNEVAVATEKVSGLENRLAQAVGTSNESSSAQVQLRDLQREADAYRAIYQSSLDKLQEAVQKQTFPLSAYRIISEAVPVMQKTWPKSLLSLAAALVAGVLFGALLALAKAYRDTSMYDFADVDRELGARLIAKFPEQKGGRNLAATAAFPSGDFARSARSLKLFLAQQKQPKQSFVVGIISTLRGDGRSTVAASLAASHAASGLRTLLIDLDLAHPDLTTAVLSSSPQRPAATLDNAKEPHLFSLGRAGNSVHFMSAKDYADENDSGDWIASSGLVELIAALKTQYDVVVLDIAPLDETLDAKALAPVVNAFIYVARWGKSQASDILRSLESVADMKPKISGFVLCSAPQVQGKFRLIKQSTTSDQASSSSRYVRANT